MNAFPLLRKKWSNEHMMAAVLVVLMLYHLPQWVKKPSDIISFLILVICGLMIDVIGSIIRHHRLWCCVSGGVTAAMVSLLAGNIPLWGKLVGVSLALILGKHLQGGTGRNVLNPAIIGIMLILPYFGIPEDFFTPSVLLIPAILLGLVFLSIRPYAGLAFMLGMVMVMLLKQEFSFDNVLAYGVLFWGCLVITDPVTVSSHPIVGGVMGLLAGALPLYFTDTPVMVVFGVLAINLFSNDLAKLFDKSPYIQKARLRIAKVFDHPNSHTEVIDLTMGDNSLTETSIEAVEARIKETIEAISEEIIEARTTDTVEARITETFEARTKDTVEARTTEAVKARTIETYEARSVEMVNGTISLSKELILERIKLNNVFGMGGAAFSTYQKILTVMEAAERSKHLIINGVECDPGLIQDEWLLRHHFSEISKGVDLLKTCIDFTSITLAVKNKEDLPEELIKLHQVKDRYPVGAEKILIKEVLGELLHREQIPAKAGILVLNVQTVYAIHDAVLLNQAIKSRYITVADLKEKTAKVVKVNLGMKLRDVMEAIYPGAMTIFAGGGIMQCSMAEEDAVVDSSINFIATGLLPSYKESPQCSGCGSCIRNCPCNLPVKRIADLVDQGKLEDAVKLRAKECLSCGSCSYSCLAGNNLAVKVRRAKEAKLIVIDKNKSIVNS